MSRLYPEHWPGWLDHARQGGGLFDSPESFVRLIQQCWEHYVRTSGVAQHVVLTPPPEIHLTFQAGTLHAPAWQPHFAYLSESFEPVLHGVKLSLSLQALEEEQQERGLPEARNFFFHIASEHLRSLHCHFYLGRQAIGVMDLGQINTQGDLRRLAIKRSLIGVTKGSDVADCYQASAAWSHLPSTMQNDLKYLGWTFGFAPQNGVLQASIQDLPSMGFPEGGDFLLGEGQSFHLGEAIDFYQGLKDGSPCETMRCRLLIVPSDEHPQAPTLESAEITLHQDPLQRAAPQLHITARIQGRMTTLNLQIITNNAQQSVALTPSNAPTDGTQIFQGSCQAWSDLQPGQEIRCIPEGTNRYGLEFPANLSHTTTVRQAVALRYEGAKAIPKGQLQREWELTFTLPQQERTHPTFALNELTLALAGGSDRTLRIPLANLSDNQLVFRYLPRFAGQQVPIEELSENDELKLWIEQSNGLTETETEQLTLSTCHNSAQAPLQTIRLLNLDETCRMLPAQKTVGVPTGAELSVEGCRMQLIGPLTRNSDSAAPPETWDLLLWAPLQPRRLDLIHRGSSWMQAQLPPQATSSGVPHTSQRDIRSLWLSCGHQDTWVEQPRERSPLGGPCLAFGMGIGSQNEMAQIRPTEFGFRLFRHRHNTPVVLNGAHLPLEPYHEAQGVALHDEHGYGWILIDRALLRYRIDKVQQTPRLSLQLIGYLLKRPSASSQTLQILCGNTSTLTPPPPASNQITQMRLAPTLPATALTLSLPQHPVQHAYPALLAQESRPEKQPSPLRYGHPYRRQQLTVMAWQIHDAGTRQVTQHPSLPTLPLLLECNSVYGRPRYALVRRQGRLGYWYEGSQFIEQGGEVEPMLAPDYTRTTPEGQEIPSNTLLIGSDVTQADLLLPPSLRWAHDLPFALTLQEQTLTILPLQGNCSLWTWKLSGEGALEHRESNGEKKLLSTTLPQSGSVLFRCEQYLFEVSTLAQDLQATPHAELLLSLRGVFASAIAPITLGGPPQAATLPIADPIPSHPHDKALMQIYTPGYSLCYRGEGIIGLKQGSAQDTLQQRLESDLAATSHTFDSTTPMALLAQITASHETSPTLPSPSLLHHRPALQWSDGFLRPSDRLQINGLELQYNLRQSPELYPPPERVPAWLTLSSPPSFVVPFSSQPDGFLMPEETPDSTPLDVVHIGRYDPESSFAEAALSKGEALLSQPVQDQGQTSAKISLFGFLPRFAARLVRTNNELFLEIPSPAQDTPYHIVLLDQPVHKASRHILEKPTYFHINHLTVCALFPEEDHVRFELLGYLLGHQRDPARPVILGQSNRVGSIHLQTIPYHGKIALQRSVCPPHFAPFEENPTRTFGPLSLPDGTRIGLVDFQQEQSDHKILQRPPHSDRLLWFDYEDSTSSGFLFPNHTLPPPPELAQQAKSNEGSSFFFDDPEDSEGSSFFFDTPDNNSSSQPYLPAPTEALSLPSTHSEDIVQHPVMRLGWLMPNAATSEDFGYISTTPGPSVTLHVHFRRLRLEPRPLHPSTQALPEIALWRMGRWQAIHTPCDLPEESLLLCGRAVFSISFQADISRVTLRRRWLWLPQGETVSLCGISPQTLVSFAAEQLPPEAQTELQNHSSRSQPTQEPPEPTFVLTLTDLPPGKYGRIYPTQRGHRIEVKNELTLTKIEDGWCVDPFTPPEQS